MVPNTKRPTDVKVKIYALAVIRVKPSKWFEPIMEDFPLLSATKMVTRTGALIACPIPPPEYCRGSKLTCLTNDAFTTIFLINKPFPNEGEKHLFVQICSPNKD